MSAGVETDLNTTYLDLMPAENLTYANDTAVINALQEEKLLSESVFDLEASMAFGAVAGLFIVIICTIGACWYVLARRKQYSDPQAMKELSKTPNSNRNMSHQKQLGGEKKQTGMVVGYQQGQNGFQSVFQNITHQTRQSSLAATPSTETDKGKRKKGR